MARYTGPKVKLSRRLGMNLFENAKGARILERRPEPPGEHGKARRRNSGSAYLQQLQEKQKAKYIYGVLERQFRRYYEKASRLSGPTGENLIRLLEMRLDNVTYRLGCASTRPQARQLVRHGHVMVNGSRVDIPSYSVKAGDEISVHEKSKNLTVVLSSVEARKGQRAPEWLEFDAEKLRGRVLNAPSRAAIPTAINEQLIVELYSK
jgi:small subunit ribosomal protein S4